MEWLEHCNKDRNDIDQEEDIRTAFSPFGEKKIGNYYLDGYKEVMTENGPCRVGYEFMGCRFHRCPHKCGIESVQTDTQFEEERKKIIFLERELDVLKVIYGCEWREEKKKIFQRGDKIASRISCFLGRKHVAEREILEAVEDGRFYGIVCVDIETPDEIVEKYKKINFPLIFKNAEIEEEMLSAEILNEARKRKTKFPVSVKTLCWNAKGYIGCSPLLQFYLKLGMKITNVQWALQFQCGKPFQEFVDTLVNERIEAETTGNTPRGDRAKLALNSAVGMIFKLILLAFQYFFLFN